MALKAYDGNEKFAFISYAHKDSKKVLKILERMAAEGYRVWYDEGIAPGSEWPENIAQHLNDCCVAVAFISNNSIASANCRREVTFALSKHKPFLGILLEPTEMSLGMELQLSAQQCILRHNFSSEEEFIQKILSSPDLAPCKNVVVFQQEEEEQEPVLAPEKPVAVPRTKPVKEKKEKSPKAPKEPKPAKTFSADQKKKLPLPLMIGAAVAAVVLAALLIFSPGKQSLPGGEEVNLNDTNVSLVDTAITSETVATLKKMEKLDSLSLTDCEISPDTLSFLQSSGIKFLYLKNCTGIEDFSFLESMSQLYFLEIVNCGFDGNVDLTGLTELNSVDFSGNAQFTDLGILPLDNMINLAFADCGVTDVSVLSGAKNLSEVNGSGNPITNIDAVTHLTGLTKLLFNNCQIGEIASPFLSLELSTIELANNKLKNTHCFDNLTVLRRVDISGNNIDRIDELAKSAANLVMLDLRGNRLADDDLDILPAMTSLAHLYLQDMVTLKNLDNIAPLTELQTLVINDTYLEDISGIAALTKLTCLDLRHNRIADLSPMSGMKFAKNMVLDLAENRLTSISAIPDGTYRLLALHDNSKLTYQPDDFKGKDGSYLTVEYHESLSSCTDAKGFAWPFVLNCPGDSQLSLKDVLNPYIYYATDDTIASMLTQQGYYYAEAVHDPY